MYHVFTRFSSDLVLMHLVLSNNRDFSLQANTALSDKESIVQAEAAAGDAVQSGPRPMLEDEASHAVMETT